jgi:uncharacterized protein (TIGR02453 family)
MISKTTLTFLKDLKANNNKEWFEDNKKRYETAKAEFEAFITDLASNIKKFDKSIGKVEPKKAIFRIYRDVRFSKNKDPYKTNFGAHLHAGDKQAVHTVAGYYIHLEPGGNSMLAGGAYMPPAEWIKAIRSEIDANSKEINRIISNKDFSGNFKIEGEKLKRPPQGFDETHKDIELLKHKSLMAVHSMADKLVLSDDFLKHVSKTFEKLYPFNKFLNRAMD